MDHAQLNYVFGLGGLALQIGALVLLALFLMRTQEGFGGQVAFVAKWALPVAFVLSLAASIMTIVYEFNPCPLCWIQRICLYPAVVMLGMALWRERYRTATIDFTIVLSVVGAGFAVYQHFLQVYPMMGLPCPASGASCARISMLEFGYITFPMLALSLFAVLVVLMLFARQRAPQMPQGTF